MLNFFTNVVTLAVATAMLIANVAMAQESPFNEDYPGLKENGGAVVIANSQVSNAIVAFQRVYNRNPDSWAEVLQSGLFDNDLVGYNMETINPDDAHIDFRGDLYLDTSTLQDLSGDVLLLSFWSVTRNDISRRSIPLGRSYVDIVNVAANALNIPGLQEIGNDWLGNEDQLIQFGHIHQIHAALLDYRETHGVFPGSISELAASGIGPLRPGSLNPVTGSPYLYDGSRGDILYELDEEGTGFVLRHVDLTHETSFQISY